MSFVMNPANDDIIARVQNNMRVQAAKKARTTTTATLRKRYAQAWADWQRLEEEAERVEALGRKPEFMIGLGLRVNMDTMITCAVELNRRYLNLVEAR